MILCCACTNNNIYTEYYKQHLNDFSNVSTYLLENYQVDKNSHLTLELNEITDNNYILNKFSCVWIEEDSVTFWNDETKTLGLTYTKNIKKYLNNITKWYKDIDIAKINDYWYLIGQFNHIL